jgi:hypothetical protein
MDGNLLLHGHALSRLLGFVAYLTTPIHGTRAATWTAGSLVLVFVARRTLFTALGCRTERIEPLCATSAAAE